MCDKISFIDITTIKENSINESISNDSEVIDALSKIKVMTPQLMSKISFSCGLIQDQQVYYLSFNGGKDCLAAYIILKYYLYCKENSKDYSEIESYESFVSSNYHSDKIVFLYFISDKHFECEEDYVINFVKQEKVKMLFCYSTYINGLNYILKQHSVNYIVMGTRYDDIKNAADASMISQTLSQESTKPYPEFLRFYPVFNFSYSEIWRLILSSNTYYLKLYDFGFSSIGDKFNTKINQYLYVNERKVYPAWYLKEEQSERAFR